ncbi:MAG: exosortase/archaeosortase family protein [Verrucomicrobia bacterium]|nr:exosortase/archaeosortase family protein [Verrucomicrobiota bacterium]MBU1908989.1 exosortase/archaeosortase family protein [Verrucomicrobiota bacterium]
MSSTDTSAQIWSERWRLAVLTPDLLIKLALAAVLVGLTFCLFHLQGNTVEIRRFSRSTILWMVGRWQDANGDNSHGWLIPWVSLWAVWHRRKEILSAPRRVSGGGLAVVVGALLMHWVGAKAQQVRLSLFALIGLLWGVPFYLYGWQVARHLVFPAAFLVFCIPLNFLDSLTFPLRLMVTVVSTHFLNGIGIAVRRSGSAIYSLAEGGFQLDVADPCSGLRSIIALTALTAVYAYLTQKNMIKKWLLFAASIPLAIIGNIARVMTIALMAEAFGQEIAVGLYHDYSGFIFFPVSLGLMILLGSLLNSDPKEVWFRWKNALLSPTSS